MNNRLNVQKLGYERVEETPDMTVKPDGAIKRALSWVARKVKNTLMIGAVVGTAITAAGGCKKTDEQMCLGDEQGTELTDNLDKREKGCRDALDTLSYDKGNEDKRARARSICFAYGNLLKSQKERARFKESSAASDGNKKVEGACRTVRARINGRIVEYESDLHPKALYIEPM